MTAMALWLLLVTLSTHGLLPIGKLHRCTFFSLLSASLHRQHDMTFKYGRDLQASYMSYIAHVLSVQSRSDMCVIKALDSACMIVTFHPPHVRCVHGKDRKVNNLPLGACCQRCWASMLYKHCLYTSLGCTQHCAGSMS